MTHWIGDPQIARERKGLAAATAPIDLAPIARAAGLHHPAGAPETVERLGVAPDPIEARRSNGGGREAGQRLSGVGRQRPVCPRYLEETPFPPAPSRLW